MHSPTTRRIFLGQLGATLVASRSVLAATTRANDKLNLGVVGVSGRGGDNLKGVSGENIVALCDVDAHNLENAAMLFPQAMTYGDFRKLLERDDLDGVVVSTPDHTHAVAVIAALRAGLHVYCEKPLARTVSEVRAMTNLARQKDQVTQLGTQIHSGDNYRRVVELVQRGAIGTVKEVHVWVASSYGGMELPKESPPVPEFLDYDLWLGPVPFRPYSPEFVPFKWRYWWAFGGGSLADFGCHFMDLPFWALDLSHPDKIEPLDGPPVHPESTPPWLIVRYSFPARESQPPVALTWHHGGRKPGFLAKELADQWASGVYFIGSKGDLLSDYSRHVLLPEDRFVDFPRPEPFIPNSIGHHLEWIEACKGRGRTTCPFSYSGPLSETALLGNVAFRAGQTLEWDAKALKASNCPAAEPFIQHRYREGWSL